MNEKEKEITIEETIKLIEEGKINPDEGFCVIKVRKFNLVNPKTNLPYMDELDLKEMIKEK